MSEQIITITIMLLRHRSHVIQPQRVQKGVVGVNFISSSVPTTAMWVWRYSNTALKHSNSFYNKQHR